MRGDGGLRGDMRAFFSRRRDPLLLDEGTAARLLAGHLEPADAPPGFAAVTRVVTAAAAPPRTDELAGENEAVAAFRAARRAPGPARRIRGLRLATLVAAAVLVLGGVAGAVSTGALPDGAQTVAHDALGAVGVSVPAPHRSRAAGPPVTRRPTSPTVPTRPANPPRGAAARVVPATPVRRSPPPPSAPPPTRRPADPRLVAACRAYVAGRISPTSRGAGASAYRSLETAAGGAPNLPGFCQGVLRGAA